MDLAGRTVVVTGGTGGLGPAVVEALLAAGADCHLPCRDEAGARDYPHRERVTLAPGCDLTDERSVERFYAGLPDLWASIHLAGGFEMSGIADTDRAALLRMVEANLVTCYLCCRFAVRRFPPLGGRIVNVAARPALEPRHGSGMTAYTASKAAVAALTQSLAAEVVEHGVLVNAVAPSIIDTPANRAAMPRANHHHWPTPQQIAATVTFLASPANAVTSGALVPVYGRA